MNAEIATVQIEMDAPTRVACWEEPYVVPGVEGTRRVTASLFAAGCVFGIGLFAGLLIPRRRAKV